VCDRLFTLGIDNVDLLAVARATIEAGGRDDHAFLVGSARRAHGRGKALDAELT
jgi:hypothetical protein